MATKTVLMVAYYFPPIATIGSMRPLGFCRYLESYDWRPRVLTTEPTSVYPPMGVDECLSEHLPKTIRLDRVPHPNPNQTLLRVRERIRRLFLKLRPDRISRSEPMANEREAEQPRVRSFAQSHRLRETLLDWLFSFPDDQCFWLRPAVEQLSSLPRGEYPKVVFATGSPWTSLLVGKNLAQKFQVPFVADLRDPWTCNPNMQIRSQFLFRKAVRLERSIYEAATCVIANTSAFRAKLIADHPDLKNKFITITNGFDPESFNPGTASTKGPARGGGDPLVTLCYFGNVYKNRNPLSLLQAAKELVDEKQIGIERLRIRFVGVWGVSEPNCEALALDLERKGILKREPRVPHEECIKQMMTADILLVLLSASPLQVPGKIYEYIATGRPLLVVGGEGATAQLLEDHQLGICCSNQVKDIKSLISRLVNGQMKIAPPRLEAQTRFAYRTLAGELAAVFDGVCAAK